MRNLNIFYKELQNYVNFVVQKRCNERYIGYKNAYKIIWPNNFTFSYGIDNGFINGLPVKSTNYSKMIVNVAIKKNFSTLADINNIDIIIDSQYFDDYVYSVCPVDKISNKYIYITF